MPRFTTLGVGASGQPAIATAEGAHHYWLVGLEVVRSPSDGGILHKGLVAVGNGRADTVHHIVLDRLSIHGSNVDADAGLQSHAGVEARGGHLAILSSRITGIQTQISPGSPCSGACIEAQGISIPNGAGPYEIRNNYIAAATENVFVGGSDWEGGQDPDHNEMAKDLTITGNHLYKPPSWFAIPYQAGHNNRLVKTTFELKAADRVLFDGNHLENCWSSVDNSFGNAIVLTPRNQNDLTPYARITDVNIVNNRIVEAQRGMVVLGDDDHHPSGPLRCTHVANNLFDQIPGDQAWSSNDGRLFTHVSGRTSGTLHLTIEHNTAFHAGPVLVAFNNGPLVPAVGFVMRNNLMHARGGGVMGLSGSAPVAEGTATFETFFGGIVFAYNDLVGASMAQRALYDLCAPDQHCRFTPDDVAVGFTAEPAGDRQVSPDSPDHRQCSHAKRHDIGAYDWAALHRAQRDAHPEP